jgi:hypothetical protein
VNYRSNFRLIKFEAYLFLGIASIARKTSDFFSGIPAVLLDRIYVYGWFFTLIAANRKFKGAT